MLHSSVGSSGDSPGSRRHGKDYGEIYQEGVPASTVLVMERRFNNLNIRVAENCLCCISSARQPEAYFRVVHYGVHGIRTRESHGTKALLPSTFAQQRHQREGLPEVGREAMPVGRPTLPALMARQRDYLCLHPGVRLLFSRGMAHF